MRNGVQICRAAVREVRSQVLNRVGSLTTILGGGLAWCRWFVSSPVRRACVLLLLSVLLIGAVDWLAAASYSQVNQASYSGRWWGGSAETPWTQAADSAAAGVRRSKKPVRVLNSVDLVIAVHGDRLSARYLASFPANGPLAARAYSDISPDSGNDLVYHVLGGVQVGEFRYGFTGNSYTYDNLSFDEPQFSRSGSAVTAIVQSVPLQLSLHRQRIWATRPGRGYFKGRERVQVNIPSIQAADIQGANFALVKSGEIALTAIGSRDIKATVWDGNSGQGWMDGLRGIGGMMVPVADGFLCWIPVLLVYGMFWWAFRRARQIFPQTPMVVVGSRISSVLLSALAVAASIELSTDICSALVGKYSWATVSIVAGPLGLLLAGLLWVWPVACVRARFTDQADIASAGRFSVVRMLAPIVMFGAVVAVYWWILGLFGVGIHAPVILKTLAVCVLVALIGSIITRGRSELSWLLSVGILLVVLAATVAWPILWYDSNGSPAEVNMAGKCIFLAGAVLTAAGLSLMAGRAAWIFSATWRKRTRWALSASAALFVALAIVPDAISEGGVLAAHAIGLTEGDLFYLFQNTTNMLDWLFLGLAGMVAVRIPDEPQSRSVARTIAIPIAIMLLVFTGYGSGWFYVPVSIILGYILMEYVLLPKALVDSVIRGITPRDALERVAGLRRQAAFFAGRQQALTDGDQGGLGELLNKADVQEFHGKISVLAGAQEGLARRGEELRRAARYGSETVFSGVHAPFSKKAGGAGLLVGSILGVASILEYLLENGPPPDYGNYPILSFLGGVAWTAFTWPAVGWFIGYFAPIIRGSNGFVKGVIVFILGFVSNLPMDVIFYDSSTWKSYAVWEAIGFPIVLACAVVVTDFRALRSADMRIADWVRVHNWRFVVTWSTAFIAAVGTAVAAFMSTAATDLSHQTVTVVSSQNQGPSPGK